MKDTATMIRETLWKMERDKQLRDQERQRQERDARDVAEMRMGRGSLAAPLDIGDVDVAYRHSSSSHHIATSLECDEAQVHITAVASPEPGSNKSASVQGTDRDALMKRRQELLIVGCKKITTTLSQEFQISDSRVRTIVREENQKATAPKQSVVSQLTAACDGR